MLLTFFMASDLLDNLALTFALLISFDFGILPCARSSRDLLGDWKPSTMCRLDDLSSNLATYSERRASIKVKRGIIKIPDEVA